MYPCKFLESRKIQGYITFQKGLQWRTHTGGMIHTDSNIRHFNIHVFRHTLFKYTLVVFLHYFNITGIWVYSIKIYKYPNLKIFRYTAVCIQSFKAWRDCCLQVTIFMRWKEALMQLEEILWQWTFYNSRLMSVVPIDAGAIASTSIPQGAASHNITLYLLLILYCMYTHSTRGPQATAADKLLLSEKLLNGCLSHQSKKTFR